MVLVSGSKHAPEGSADPASPVRMDSRLGDDGPARDLDIAVDDLNDELPAWTDDPDAGMDVVRAEPYRGEHEREPELLEGEEAQDAFDAALGSSLDQLDAHLWQDFDDPSKVSQQSGSVASLSGPALPEFPSDPAVQPVPAAQLQSFPGAAPLPYRMTPPPPMAGPTTAPAEPLITAEIPIADAAEATARAAGPSLTGLGDDLADPDVMPSDGPAPQGAISADLPLATADVVLKMQAEAPALPPPPVRSPRTHRIFPEYQLPKKHERDTLPKPAPSQHIIGIDLGTTNCCAAVVKDGTAFVLAARDGGSTTPSAVCFAQNGHVYVGTEAQRRASSDPLNTIVGSKRMIGRPFHSPIVQSIRTHFAYPIVQGEEGEAAVDISQEIVSLEEVAAYLLEDIRKAASLQLGEDVTRAVITCPAFYNERQREAVRIAGELAGMTVERVLSEPTAAALNYGIGQTMQTRRVAVYDLGGGTFDVSVLEVDGNVYEVLATGGDTFLGGIDFDACIAEMIVEAILAQGGPDPRRDAAAVARIMQYAEQAKKALTERPATIVNIQDLSVFGRDAIQLSVPIRREETDRRLEGLLKQTAQIVEDVCERAGVGPQDVDDVLLVGGQTRYPAVQRTVAQIFGKPPRASMHPEEAVALGAAQYAAGMETIDNVVLLDALPMSIGLALPGGHFYKLIERDSRLPAEGACLLPTSQKNQSEMEVALFQGDADHVELNEPLGSLLVTGLPPGAIGSITVEIRARVNEESILQVTATEPYTERTFESRFATKSTPERWRRSLEGDHAPSSSASMAPSPTHALVPAHVSAEELDSIQGGPKKVWRWLTGLFGR